MTTIRDVAERAGVSTTTVPHVINRTRRVDPATAAKVEAAIECMKLDGTLTKLSQKWFGVTPAPGSAAVTVHAGYGEPGFEGHDPAPHAPKCM